MESGPTELEREQSHVDRAYAALDAARSRALGLRSMVEVGQGGTTQARVEADVIEDTIRDRLAQLELGDQALVFGRIDTDDDDTFHIGRIAVADADDEPLVVDWRAPVAEPFYRATGREPMGLARRRHFVTRGDRLLGLEDEFFGDAVRSGRLRGEGALLDALEQNRTGSLGDIVGTIQAEQDDVIRDQLSGIVIVQGGPGTGKTVVALHRAAYLLYTHRFPLEGQGVLVVGPNRLFLRYIERVLPSLGEAGAELAVLADLVGDHVPAGLVPAIDPPVPARLKGDLRMVKVVKRAVRDRQRRLREPLTVDFGVQRLRLGVERSGEIVADARRRFRHHNAGRRLVEREVFEALALSARRGELDPEVVRRRLRRTPEVRAALEWMWPVLTPADLLHDLFGSAALVRSATTGIFDPTEAATLVRERLPSSDDVAWTEGDLPLLDEAHRLLGARPDQAPEEAEVRTYGHLVIDEAQDHSPMALRMLARRSLNGSMTVVGDIAQATSAGAAASWDEVVALLGRDGGARRRELTLGYRIPGPIMELAAGVLTEAEPELSPPESVRTRGDRPLIRRADDLPAAVVEAVRRERRLVGEGSVAVIAPEGLVGDLGEALDRAGIDHARLGSTLRLDHPTTIVPPRLVKGLEVDAAIVVEPARIVSDDPRGLRSLYVALTRPTKRLSVVHRDPLPETLRVQGPPEPRVPTNLAAGD